MAFALSDVGRAAIRAGATISYTVDATLGGKAVATGLAPSGGSITDTSKPGVRRVLSVDLPPTPGLWDALSVPGIRLAVTSHIRLANRSVIDVPMGVFEVDTAKRTEGVGGISLTAPDKWVRIKRAGFVQPVASSPLQTVTSQIVTLIQGALGTSEPVNVTTTSQAQVGTQTWDKDREKAILDMATSIGAWVFFDRLGVATIADVPTTGATPDWLVDAGTATGVMTQLSRTRDRTSASNVVVVNSTATDNPFPTQVVWDTDPSSPTYAGPDPINYPEQAGPFGVSVFYYDTALPLDAVGARNTGLSILARESGLASTVTLGQVPNPAADAFDVLDVMPPPELGRARVLERHIADTVTHGLTVGAEQAIDGRSTRLEVLS